MSSRYQSLRDALQSTLGESVVEFSGEGADMTVVVEPGALIDVCRTLRDDPALQFDMLIDVCGVDYLTYGQAEWTTNAATGSGFSRGVDREPVVVDYTSDFDPRRFASVYHLLSTVHNRRLRVRCYSGSANPPVVPSVVPIWASANWFEREAFDLYGILFEGHPDLRRILTDYGFIGHPFRKDFPLSGTVEVRYDPEKGRVAYQPVSIEPRTLVPRVIRDDSRYEEALRDGGK